jgi:ribosomal protein L12E/L44/L45/RPP1/RPP2
MIKTVVDDKGITFTPEGHVVIITGVNPEETNVYAEISEVHTKTILAKKIVAEMPAVASNGNGYEIDDAHEDDYEEEEDEPEEEEGDE